MQSSTKEDKSPLRPHLGPVPSQVSRPWSITCIPTAGARTLNYQRTQVPSAKGQTGTEREHVHEGTAKSSTFAGLSLSAAGRPVLPSGRTGIAREWELEASNEPPLLLGVTQGTRHSSPWLLCTSRESRCWREKERCRSESQAPEHPPDQRHGQPQPGPAVPWPLNKASPRSPFLSTGTAEVPVPRTAES